MNSVLILIASVNSKTFSAAISPQPDWTAAISPQGLSNLAPGTKSTPSSHPKTAIVCVTLQRDIKKTFQKILGINFEVSAKK